MRRSLLSLLLLLCCAPLALAATDAEIAARLHQYLRIRSDMGAFSGAVLVSRNGEVIFRRAYGYADVERRTPFTPDTQFEVASISKMFTAMAALKLRDEGKLRLDDRICKYVTGCPDAWQPITIQQLMRHTSGIPDYESALDFGSPEYIKFMTRSDATEQIVRDAMQKPLDYAPGTKFSYSNTGYIVLASIIQKAAGLPFAGFVRTRLLRPARMRHSGVLGTDDKPSRLANGYTHGDLGWPAYLAGIPLLEENLQRYPQLALTPPAGDAWLYSTIDDLNRWSAVMDGSTVVPAPEAAEVFTPGEGGYGYGWFIDTQFGRRRYRHTGSLPGYTSDFIKFPDDHMTIVVISNLDRAPMKHIVRNVSLIALGMPYDMPVRGKAITLTEAQIHALEGDYRMANGDVVTVHNGAPFLTAEIKRQYTAGLIPLSPTKFYMPLSDGVVTFTLDDSGKASSVNIHYSAEDRIATRIPPEAVK